MLIEVIVAHLMGGTDFCVLFGKKKLTPCESVISGIVNSLTFCFPYFWGS